MGNKSYTITQLLQQPLLLSPSVSPGVVPGAVISQRRLKVSPRPSGNGENVPGPLTPGRVPEPSIVEDSCNEVLSKHGSTASAFVRSSGSGFQHSFNISHILSVNNAPPSPPGLSGRSPSRTFLMMRGLPFGENGVSPLRTSKITIPSA